MIGSAVANSDAIPVLEMVMRYAGQRQRLISHNIANIDTPEFLPMDVSPQTFQKNLRKAVESRRQKTGGMHGTLDWEETNELQKDDNGELALKPLTPSRNILFHDRNNRDTERLMQDLAENGSVFRVATELLRMRYQMLNSAIAERV